MAHLEHSALKHQKTLFYNRQLEGLIVLSFVDLMIVIIQGSSSLESWLIYSSCLVQGDL